MPMKKQILKRVGAIFLCVLMVMTPTFSVNAASTQANAPSPDLNCTSAILMEATTGAVLYEKNADQPLPPASVTKIMTLLLVMEAIESGSAKLDDTVTASAYASSMGGSQIFLKEGEQMSLEDMLKSVIIASANDCAVALAEHISGSEEVFVARMNERARELGMVNTNFENTNGLDDTAQNHVTSARDIAIMSRELIKYEKVLEYSSKWMDTVRNGEFGLTNTNRLVRFYSGITGLKTGSTAKAGFCISASAKRDRLSLVAVIMGSPTRDERNNAAKKLLDLGFASYALYESRPELPECIRVTGGTKSSCSIASDSFSAVVEKGRASEVNFTVELPGRLSAPLKNGERIGCIKYSLDGKTIGEIPICTSENVEKIGFFDVLGRMLGVLFMR